MKMAFVAYRGGKPGTANLSLWTLAQFTNGKLFTEDMDQALEIIECPRFEDKSGNGVGLLVDHIPNHLDAAAYRMGDREKRLKIAMKVVRGRESMLSMRAKQTKEKAATKAKSKETKKTVVKKTESKAARKTATRK